MQDLFNFAFEYLWVLLTVIIHFTVLGVVAYLILLERKTASWVQDRLGPNRTGLGFGIIPGLKDFHFWGLGQPLADGLKFVMKEDYRPGGVDRILFSLAPMIMIVTVIVSIAVIPWGGVLQRTAKVSDGADPTAVVPVTGSVVALGETAVTYQMPFQIANLNIGVLFVLATLSLAVYGVVVGGYASNNKFSFLGGLRATANMISYEIPLGVSVLAVVLLFGTLDLGAIVAAQTHTWAGWVPAWNVFLHPVAFLLFLICIHAEANRAPFDLAEAEQELVGGYHTEYSSMRFALFFLAEYAGMITTSAVCVALFFGGWHLPFGLLDGKVIAGNPVVTDNLLVCILRTVVFFGKTVLILFIFMWVRWSLPRFRFDQLMMLAWRALIPISLALLMMTALVVYFWGTTPRTLINGTMIVPGKMALWMLLGNGLVVVGALIGSQFFPDAPDTNRRMKVSGSRFSTPRSIPTA